MLGSDTREYIVYIFDTLNGYERFSVLLDSSESMEVLDEMLTALEYTLSSLVCDE